MRVHTPPENPTYRYEPDEWSPTGAPFNIIDEQTERRVAVCMEESVAKKLVDLMNKGLEAEELRQRNRDMLEALHAAERELRFAVHEMGRKGGLYEAALDKVQAAIAKAEGQS